MEYLDDNQLAPPVNGGRRYVIFGYVIVLLIAFFVLATGFFWWWNCGSFPKCRPATGLSNLEINGEVIKKNETVAKLTANVIKSQIDGLLTIGSFYANKPEIRQLIQRGKWQEAANLALTAIKEEQYIDRVTLFDMAGKMMSSVPNSQLNNIGKVYADRDWYKGVVASSKPYVSGVFIRDGDTPFNAVGISFPIFNNNDLPAAIMLFTVRTDTFLKWLNGITFGNTGLSFIVDQRGHVVAHPEIPPQNTIADFSSRTEVQKVISDQSGTEISIDSKRKRTLSSYEPIAYIHWGVITKIELDEVINSGLIKDNSSR